jgi:hypothetical protein
MGVRDGRDVTLWGPAPSGWPAKRARQNFASEMQWFESCRPSQTVRSSPLFACGLVKSPPVTRHSREMVQSPRPGSGTESVVPPPTCLLGLFLVSRFPGCCGYNQFQTSPPSTTVGTKGILSSSSTSTTEVQETHSGL